MPSSEPDLEPVDEAAQSGQIPMPAPTPRRTTPAAHAEVTAAAQSLMRLLAATGPQGARFEAVRDIRAILSAQDADQRHDQARAVAAWYEALGVAQGSLGKLALDGWLKSYTLHLGKVSDPVVLARLVMAETQGGQHSPYMVQRGLTRDQEIIPVLWLAVPQWLSGEPPHATSGQDLPPQGAGTNPDDPLLVKAAAASCRAHDLAVQQWHTWIQTLPPAVLGYWNGLVAQHCGSASTAIDALAAAYPELAGSPATAAMAVEAATRTAVLQRANDRRTDAAQTYSDLMELWGKPGVTASAMGLDSAGFALRRIDDTLSAARYRALIGDYEGAKIQAHFALKLIGNAHSAPGLSASTREQLADFKAEAYHALAFRVAVEQHDFESASAQAILALQTPGLSREWQDRLNWYAGLYDSLAGHPESAKQRWDSLLARTKDESLKSTLNFWLARVSDKLGRRDEAKAYLAQLIEESPLSFYATVAPVVSGLNAGSPAWEAVFGNLNELPARLAQRHDFGLARLRQSRDLAPLLLRAEILVIADLGELARLAVDELAGTMETELPLEPNTPAYVYLTRLWYRCGSYLKAISMTTKLARAQHGFWREYPEQVLVVFPRPYLDDFRRNALDNGLEPELLLGISRQESGFTPSARSSANAVGLMQLILPTGHRFAAELGMDTSDMEALLRVPAANIRIGSRYLRYLSLTFNQFPPAIYGGYNAGDYAITSWLKRRGHSDPLMFTELVPFSETRDYIKSVWRNVTVYHQLRHIPVTQPALDLIPYRAVPASSRPVGSAAP